MLPQMQFFKTVEETKVLRDEMKVCIEAHHPVCYVARAPPNLFYFQVCLLFGYKITS